MSENTFHPDADEPQALAGNDEARPATPAIGTAGCDAVVIGAGHNGLVAAAFLAKAGLDVQVLEARDTLGGMASNGAIEPGFEMPVCAHVLSHLDGGLIKDLDLYRHGLDYAERRLETTALDEDGRVLSLPADPARARQALVDCAPEDRDAFGALMGRLGRLGGVAASLFHASPPVIGGQPAAAEMRVLNQALKRLSAADARHLAAMVHGRVSEILERDFEDPLLKGLLGFDAGLGAAVAPAAPGSALAWLHRLAGECAGLQGGLGLPKGGMGAVSLAISQAAQAAGAQIRTRTPVRAISVQDGRVNGVVVGSGETIRARYVLSSLDPQTTYLGLLGTRHLAIEAVRRLKRWRARGTSAKVNISLEALPAFRELTDTHLRGRVVLSPSLDYLESAYRPVKYGEMSTYPALEIVVPSLSDPELAPAGKHVMSVVVQYVPYSASASANEALRRHLARAVVDRLSYFAPALPDQVRKVAVLTPRDMEAAFGSRGGHWHQGDLSADQVWSYRDIDGVLADGLVLCGAGAHPGGGVSGRPGSLAARRVLAMEDVA